MVKNTVSVFASVLYLLAVGAQATERASTATGGAQGNGESITPAISEDGRYVLFESAADNLVTGDTNGVRDVFIRDMQTGLTTCVSTDSSGNQAVNGSSYGASASSDGRYVVFVSGADDLVAGDTNGVTDIFLKDRQTGVTVRVSTGSSGTQSNGPSYTPQISADGRYVVFQSGADSLVANDANGVADIYLKDTLTGQLSRISTDSGGVEGTGGSATPAISSDGRYVVFHSGADNLVSGDTNGADDVFRKDTQTGTVIRVSTDSSDSQAISGGIVPAISASGRYVAFESNSSDLVAGDTNGAFDIFLKDIHTGLTKRVSADAGGTQANSGSLRPVISADGRYVSFDTFAGNLVAGDTNGAKDVLVKDMANGAIVRVSTDSSGNQANDSSVFPAISADGRYVAFASLATNLVAGDTNKVFDVFRNTSPVYVDDTDSDGVRDDIELLVGTDPNSADTDGDGLGDYSELNRDLDPYTYTPGADTDPNNMDTDGDGFNDGQEAYFGSDPLQSGDTPANGDITEDGLVGAADVLLAMRIATGGIVSPTADQLVRADVAPFVNGLPVPDGRIDAGDVMRILRLALGLQ